MAGKRLVMGKSPGTGLFAAEPKTQIKPRGSSVPGAARGVQKVPGGDQEEERVNSQLVEILERKCSKLRERLDEAAERRAKAEEDVESHAADLAETRRRLEERDQQIRDLCVAQRDSAEHRLAAKQQAASLSGVQADLDAAQQALSGRTRELETLRARVAKSDADWKGQVVQLVAEMQTVAGRTSNMAAELDQAHEENARLKEGALELMGRYELESARRLELEEQCLVFEEKKRSSNEKCRDDVSSAQQKAKEALQGRKRADDLARQRDEQGKEGLARAKAAEARCQSLEAEVKRLRADASERRRVGPPSVPAGQRVVAQPPSVPAEEERLPSRGGPAEAAAATAVNAGGGGCASQPPRLPSRPSSAAAPAAPAAANPRSSPSVRAVSSVQASRAASAHPGRSSAGPAPAARGMAPGAIRRAGSVPARFGREAAETQGPAAASARAPSVASAPSSLKPLGAPVDSAGARPRSCASSRPGTAAYSRPSSAAYSDAADPDIDGGIPSDDGEDDSSDEELLSAVKKS